MAMMYWCLESKDERCLIQIKCHEWIQNNNLSSASPSHLVEKDIKVQPPILAYKLGELGPLLSPTVFQKPIVYEQWAFVCVVVCYRPLTCSIVVRVCLAIFNKDAMTWVSMAMSGLNHAAYCPAPACESALSSK